MAEEIYEVKRVFIPNSLEGALRQHFLPEKRELFPITIRGKKFIGSGEDAMPYANQSFLEWNADCEPTEASA